MGAFATDDCVLIENRKKPAFSLCVHLQETTKVALIRNGL